MDRILRIKPKFTRKQTDLRVHNYVSWSIKTAWLQKEIDIQAITHQRSNEPQPWKEPAPKVVHEYKIRRKLNP